MELSTRGQPGQSGVTLAKNMLGTASQERLYGWEWALQLCLLSSPTDHGRQVGVVIRSWLPCYLGSIEVFRNYPALELHNGFAFPCDGVA